MFGKILRFITPIIVLTASVAIGFALMKTGPVPEKKPTFATVPVVEVIRAEPTSYTPVIEGSGVVVPAKQLALHAEVSGRLLEVHEALVPGGLIHENETLFRINDEEYELALAQQQANVAQAELELTVEQGRHSVAAHEWDRIESDLDVTTEGRELALRRPQLDHAERRLRAAQSGVDRAQLNVDRTEIAAPFNALVLSENVERDLLVTPQTRLASLVGTDTFWVQASLPVKSLAWIAFSEDGESPETRVIQGDEPARKVVRKARLLRLLGEVEARGRMARVLIAVDDPLLLEGESSLIEVPDAAPEEPTDTEETPAETSEPSQEEAPSESDTSEEQDEAEEEEEVIIRAPAPRFKKLLLGSYVQVSIQSDPLENVFVLGREVLRDGDKIWVVTKDDTLEVRTAQILWRTPEQIIVGDGLKKDDRVIASKLQAPVDGMKVKVLSEQGLPTKENPPEEPDSAKEEEPGVDEESSPSEGVEDSP